MGNTKNEGNAFRHTEGVWDVDTYGSRDGNVTSLVIHCGPTGQCLPRGQLHVQLQHDGTAVHRKTDGTALPPATALLSALGHPTPGGLFSAGAKTMPVTQGATPEPQDHTPTTHLGTIRVLVTAGWYYGVLANGCGRHPANKCHWLDGNCHVPGIHVEREYYAGNGGPDFCAGIEADGTLPYSMDNHACTLTSSPP